MNMKGACREDVVAIREMRAEGYTCTDIAAEFNVSICAVSHIVRGIWYPDAGGPITNKNQVAAKRRRRERPLRHREIQSLKSSRAEAVHLLGFFEELLDGDCPMPQFRQFWQAQAAAERKTIAAIDAELAAKGATL